VAKVGKPNSDRTISLRLQCVIKKHKISTMLRLPEDDADASKHVELHTIYKILIICIYIIHLLVCIINCANARYVRQILKIKE
jgi:hypothetical protein